MNVQDKPYPVVDLLIETFSDWLKHRHELKEMREMDAVSFDQIASDLRISSADLEQLVRQGPHTGFFCPTGQSGTSMPQVIRFSMNTASSSSLLVLL
jgi:hypothetical protein